MHLWRWLSRPKKGRGEKGVQNVVKDGQNEAKDVLKVVAKGDQEALGNADLVGRRAGHQHSAPAKSCRLRWWNVSHSPPSNWKNSKRCNRMFALAWTRS